MYKKFYELSSKKYTVMNILWNAEKVLSFNEILERAGNIKAKKLSAIINKLIKKKYIIAVDKLLGITIDETLYYPNISKDEYIDKYNENFFYKYRRFFITAFPF